LMLPGGTLFRHLLQQWLSSTCKCRFGLRQLAHKVALGMSL